MIKPRRSVLYMPGSNARALEKAKTLAADALILDLEDAVAPDAKELARSQVCEAVKAGGYGAHKIVIRVNGFSTPYGEADFAAALEAMPDAILLPKIETAADLDLARKRAPNGTGISLWAMIETPLAIFNLKEIAQAAASNELPLTCFVLGTNDLVKATRVLPGADRLPLIAWLSLTVAAARAYGIAVVDGVYNSIKDEEGFRAECVQGRALGMDGKTLIHPNQLAVCNEVFSPSAEEIAAATKIVEAFDLPENQGKGAISLDGRMVERLHADIARQTLAMAEAIARPKH
ncbi:malyl-CoA thiolesterase [Rhodomicrobium udaipurense JA643]|uniref:CoA ester lyase n=1 Tax=Rhodomicrobium udaipurense TaxID=1202716 RepID=A0A8I1KJA9_9HYPH|nr:CoA ester lyase [Rhodomicrobium udaipurense]KAI93986.1 malyl-CoA thiolesterase [Rhodomicrobium udaipurense JA643]MBJ7543552.1 CoA ester lyase [Rhodomicrobium udaipurense]